MEDDKFVEMMDMMVRIELVKSIGDSLRSITDNFKNDILGDFKGMSLEELQSLSSAFDNLDKAILDISKKEENKNGEV